jgi:Protein of unknown function (DUF1064)
VANLQKRYPKGHQHRYFVDSETGDAVCLCGKVRGEKKAAPGKYRALRTEYNGVYYDSMFEAQTAMDLDWRLKANAIKGWARQFPIEIRSPHTGELILRHKVDFRIGHNDGSFELLECKGFETRDWRITKRLIEELWLPENLDHVYTVAK